MFCHVAPEQVIGVHDVSSVYHVPLLLQSQGIVDYLRKRLNLGALTLTQEMKDRGTDLESRWRELTKRYGSIWWIGLPMVTPWLGKNGSSTT